jgi:nucleotide-binding universal stress UspA family protein
MGVIVVGYDGSEGSRASLDRACELAQALSDSVLVVFGAAAHGAVGGEMASTEKAIEERGEQVMKHAADQAAANGFEVETKVVRQAHPAEALIQEAESADARMVVVGNQGGPSPLKGAILGAVPYKLVHLSPVPVLVVPAG